MLSPRHFLASSIRRRILAGFVMVALLVALTAAANVVQLNQVTAFSQQIIPDSSQMSHLQSLTLATSALDVDLERFLIVRSAEARDVVQQDLTDLAAALDAMQADVNDANRGALSEINTIAARLKVQVLALLDVNFTASAGLNQRIVDIYADIEQVKQVQRGLADSTLNQLQTAAQNQGIIASNVLGQSVILGLIVFVIAAFAVVLVNRALRPIGTLTDTVAAIAGGDLNRTAPVQGIDEISRLATAFNSMTEQVRGMVSTLEQRVQARTQQLQASADVGRAAASILDTDELLRQVVNLITDRFGFYYAAIFLADDTNEWAVLREGTGEAGRTLKERGHRLALGGQSMVGSAMQLRHSRIALDVGVEAVRFSNPLLPETRSEIALPLVVGNRVLGALDVQSKQAGAFDETSAAVLQSMVDQIAIALNNASQFQQTESALKRTNLLYATTQSLSQATTPEQVLAAIAQVVSEDANRAGLLLYELGRDSRTLESVEMAATWLHPDYAHALTSIKPSTRLTPNQMPVVEYILPDQPLIVNDSDADTVPLPVRQVMQRFGAQAMIGLSLTAGHKQLGALTIGFPTARTFDANQLQIYSTLARQTAIVLQNQQSVKSSEAALEQLNRLNQRLIGQAWQEYTATVGGGIRKAKTFDASDALQSRLPSTMTAPVTVNGVEIGALRLEDATPDRVWTSTEVTLLQTIASEVSIALERARLTEETEGQARRERTINRITSQLRNAQSVEQVLNIATQELRAATRSALTVAEITPGRAPQADAPTSSGQPPLDHAVRSEA